MCEQTLDHTLHLEGNIKVRQAVRLATHKGGQLAELGLIGCAARIGVLREYQPIWVRAVPTRQLIPIF